MTNVEILERAIQMAIENGWDATNFETLKSSYHHPEESEFLDLLGDWHNISPYDIIFNQDFAKSLWGDWRKYGHSVVAVYQGNKHGIAPITLSLTVPQFHQQMMLVSADPIKYLGEHLPK